MTNLIQPNEFMETNGSRMPLFLKCIAALVFGIMAFAAVWAWYQIGFRHGADTSLVTVRIETGSNAHGIATQLAESDLISSPLLFRWYLQVQGRAAQLQAGTYAIPRNASLGDIARQLTAIGGDGGKVVDQVRVVEGWTAAQMGAYFSEQQLFDTADFSRIVAEGSLPKTASALLGEGKPAGSSLEGYLFPDTYQVSSKTTAEEMVDTMVTNVDERIDDAMRERIATSEMSFYEILTLASIIEKEVRTPEERRVVAGIFLQRLEDGYPLQSDATIHYITRSKENRATGDELELDSPYNSYKYIGLPPGPISNPGLDSITAVLEPTLTDYYFFLTTPAGRAVYAETYEQHLQNKAEYYP